jgi:MFS family permease
VTAAQAPTPLRPLTLIVLCGTILLSVANASMTSLTMPGIQRDFGVATDDLAWVVTAYLIPFATGTVLYGRLADMFGTRRMYLFGLVLFAAASFAVAAAPTFGLLVGARALQGFGGTAIPSLSMATIIRTTTPHDRGRAMGATILTVGVGFGIGPLAGGALTELGGWHGPFVATGIGAAAIVPLALFLVPSVQGLAGQRFDFAGATFLTGAVTGDVLALNRLPSHPGDALGLAGLIVSLPLWVLLIHRVRTAAEPFINREVAGNRGFLALAVLGFTAQGAHFAVIVMIPLLLTGTHGMGVIDVGLRLLPGAVAIAFCGMAGGLLLNRLGARPLLVTGTALLLAGVAVFHLSGTGWGPWAIGLLYVVIASGYGLVNAAVVTAATGRLPQRLAGVGSGTFNLVFFLGGAVSVALAGAILRRRAGAADAFDPLVRGGQAAYSDALLVVIAFAVLGLVLALAFAPGRMRPSSSSQR